MPSGVFRGGGGGGGGGAQGAKAPPSDTRMNIIKNEINSNSPSQRARDTYA